MELSQDLLLPILIVTIIANIAIVLVLLASGRIGRNKHVATTGTTTPRFEHAIMSTSYSDRSASGTWPETATTSLPDDTATDPTASAAIDAGMTELPAEPVEAEASPESATSLPTSPTPVLVEDGIDHLTGLPDASAFHRLVADEDARIARYHHNATVVIFELDGLERLVERLGADAGDRVVPPLADTLRRLARGADHVARLGPGRFAALLPETDEVAAINYVERVRRACELWLESGAIALRLAIGWAGTNGDPTLTEAQRLATDRMYVELRRGARRADGTATLDSPVS